MHINKHVGRVSSHNADVSKIIVMSGKKKGVGLDSGASRLAILIEERGGSAHVAREVG